MSWQAKNWVLYHSEVDEYVQFRVLMLLADRADAEGRGAWPSQEELSKAVRRTDRTIRRALKALADAGHVEKVGRSKHVAYNLVMSESVNFGADDGEENRTHDVRIEGGSENENRTSDVQDNRTHDVRENRTSDVHRTVLEQSNEQSSSLERQLPIVLPVGNDDSDDITCPTPNASQPPNLRLVPPRTEKPRRGQSTEIPDDWMPNAEHYKFAAGEGLDERKVARDAENFRDRHQARGTKLRDWDIEFRSWLRKSAEYAAQRPRTARAGATPSSLPRNATREEIARAAAEATEAAVRRAARNQATA